MRRSTSSCPLLVALALLAAWWRLTSQVGRAVALVCLIATTASCDGGGKVALPPRGGTITTLTDADTLWIRFAEPRVAHTTIGDHQAIVAGHLEG